MLIIENIVRRGYFPAELQPPFRTSTLADLCSFVTPSALADWTRSTISLAHSYARPGTLRRKLGIPSPLNFVPLAIEIEEGWEHLSAVYSSTELSRSRPVLSDRRSVSQSSHWRDLPKERALVRSTARYILKTDISKFYGSIYTHTIPWALHGKEVAKRNRSDTLLGNRLDKLIRNCQDGQTIGIPVGPDTSYLISEAILSVIDVEICRRITVNGFRHADDYEFGFNTYADAHSALSSLQSILSEFELSLNPTKTSILELPQDVEKPWVRQLSAFDLREDLPMSKGRLLDFFQLAFELKRQYSADSVLGFALSRFTNIRHSAHWSTFEQLLYQCARVDVTTLSKVVGLLVKNTLDGLGLQRDLLQQVISNTVIECAPLRHSSEVAWAIWAAMVFEIPLNDKAVECLRTLDDSVVALLALHARKLRVIGRDEEFPAWQSAMCAEGLEGEQWLLAYEARMKRWTGSSRNYVTGHPVFKLLWESGVSFYDLNMLQLSRTEPPPMPERGLMASAFMAS